MAKEKRKFKRGDYRLTPLGGVLVRTVPATLASIIILIACFLVPEGMGILVAITLYSLVIQAMVSIIVGTLLCIAGSMGIDFNDETWVADYPIAWLNAAILLPFTVGIAFLILTVVVEKVE